VTLPTTTSAPFGNSVVGGLANILNGEKSAITLDKKINFLNLNIKKYFENNYASVKITSAPVEELYTKILDSKKLFVNYFQIIFNAKRGPTTDPNSINQPIVF